MVRPVEIFIPTPRANKPNLRTTLPFYFESCGKYLLKGDREINNQVACNPTMFPVWRKYTHTHTQPLHYSVASPL